jgi:hypothetical protein
MPPYYSRSNQWIRSTGVTVGTACQTRTDETSPIMARVQAPVVVVCSARPASTLFTVTASQPQRMPALHPRAEPAPAEVRPAPPVTDTAVGVPSPEVSDETEPSAPNEPEKQAAENGQFELIIEELPRHKLRQAIAVQLQPVGTEMFCASVAELALTVKGGSVSEALLILKGRIEATYIELDQKATLDDVEKEQLKFYRSHIVDDPTKRRRVHEPASSSSSKQPSRWAGRW